MTRQLRGTMGLAPQMLDASRLVRRFAAAFDRKPFTCPDCTQSYPWHMSDCPDATWDGPQILTEEASAAMAYVSGCQATHCDCAQRPDVATVALDCPQRGGTT